MEIEQTRALKGQDHPLLYAMAHLSCHYIDCLFSLWPILGVVHTGLRGDDPNVVLTTQDVVLTNFV